MVTAQARRLGYWVLVPLSSSRSFLFSCSTDIRKVHTYSALSLRRCRRQAAQGPGFLAVDLTMPRTMPSVPFTSGQTFVVNVLFLGPGFFFVSVSSAASEEREYSLVFAAKRIGASGSEGYKQRFVLGQNKSALEMVGAGGGVLLNFAAGAAGIWAVVPVDSSVSRRESPFRFRWRSAAR